MQLIAFGHPEPVSASRAETRDHTTHSRGRDDVRRQRGKPVPALPEPDDLAVLPRDPKQAGSHSHCGEVAGGGYSSQLGEKSDDGHGWNAARAPQFARAARDELW